MVERIFNDPLAWGILAGFAVLSFVISLIFKKNLEGPKDDRSSISSIALLRGLEAVVLTVLGGLIARAFISLLLGSANNSAAVGLAVGWCFFLVPGIVDTIPYLTHGHPALTTPENLLMFATVVGGMSGAVSGLWRIYSWLGLGWIAFPLDVTWALAGNTVGCLLHLINIGWGDHGKATRENAHRYNSGFGWKTFAFTQGAVMSNLSDTGDLYRHERTHVWQNRGFGPMYTLTYLGWMAVWVVPSLFAAAIKLPFSRIFSGPMDWCYFNNPWETWAYKVQNAERTKIVGNDAEDQKLIWPGKWVIAWSIPFFAVATVLAVLVVVSVWNGAPPPSHKSKQPAPRSHERSSFDPGSPSVDLDRAIG
jgi:hypothetical protein